jgi:hypothetical protein
LLQQVPERYIHDLGPVPTVTSIVPVALRTIPVFLQCPALMELAGSSLWRAGEVSFPAGFAGRSAILELIGPSGLAVSSVIRSGLYFQAPDCLYPSHSHSAEEFYLVLSGTASWQKDEENFEVKNSGALIHHHPWMSHAMQTYEEPLLAAWIWTGGDLTYGTYRIGE